MEIQQPTSPSLQEPILVAAFHQPPTEEKIIRPVNLPQPILYIGGSISILISLFFFCAPFPLSYMNLLDSCLSIFMGILFFLFGLFCIITYTSSTTKNLKKQFLKNPTLYTNDTYTYFYDTHFHINQSGPLTTYASNLPYSDILGVIETIYVIQIKTSTGYYTVFKEDVTYGSPGSLATFLKSMLPSNLYQGG